MKKFAWVVFSYCIVTFGIAYPWHFIWFKDLVHELEMYDKPEPIFILGISAMLIQGAFIAHFYPPFHKENAPLASGIRFCLLVGAFLFSVSTLANAAKISVTSIPTFISLQAAFHLVQFVLVGITVGWIHGKRR